MNSTMQILTKDVFITQLNEIIKCYIDLYMITESNHYLEVIKQLHERMDTLLGPEFEYYGKCSKCQVE